MSQSATLWPAGISSRTVTGSPSTRSSVPAGRGTRATATLSVGWRWMVEFSALGTFVISTSMFLSFELQFADRLFDVSMQAVSHGVNPDAVAILGHGNFGGSVDDDELVILRIGEKLADVNVNVALGALHGGIESDAPGLVSPDLARLGNGSG